MQSYLSIILKGVVLLYYTVCNDSGTFGHWYDFINGGSGQQFRSKWLRDVVMFEVFFILGEFTVNAEIMLGE